MGRSTKEVVTGDTEVVSDEEEEIDVKEEGEGKEGDDEDDDDIRGGTASNITGNCEFCTCTYIKLILEEFCNSDPRYSK